MINSYYTGRSSRSRTAEVTQVTRNTSAGCGKCRDEWGNTSLLGITLLFAWICKSKCTMKDEKNHSISTKGTKYPEQSPSFSTEPLSLVQRQKLASKWDFYCK